MNLLLRSEANLFTLTSDVAVHDLPGTLRNVQNFDCSEGLSHLCGYIKNILPKQVQQEEIVNEVDAGERNISIITGRQVNKDDYRPDGDLPKVFFEYKNICVKTRYIRHCDIETDCIHYGYGA